jgi:acetyl esterase
MISEHDQEILKEWQDFLQRMPATLDGMRAAYASWSESHNHDFPKIDSYQKGIALRDDLRCDIAVPKSREPFPVIVYIHGGGWVMGSASTHRKLVIQLAQLGYLVFNLDYRLAPENPYPAGLDDCIFAVRWIYQNAGRWNGDPNRIVVAGDSAGANLSAATMLALGSGKAGNGSLQIRAGILIYGLFDVAAAIERSRATGSVEGVAKAYLAHSFPSLLKEPRVSPLAGVGQGKLPPCLLIVGDADDLLPESQAMANALSVAGIQYRLRIFEGMPHAFMQMGELSACLAGLEEIRDFLKKYA